MSQSLDKQVIIVTGAASGIGAELVKTCLAQGATVCGLDLNPLPYEHHNLLPYQLDVSSESAIDQTIDDIEQKHHRIDALINNAGIQIIAPIENFELSHWKKIFDVMVHGSFLLSKACIKVMKKTDKLTSIINIGSIHSYEASLNKSAYVTAKHALVGLTRALAKEGAAYNIKANLVGPGFVKTPLVEKQIPEQAKSLGITEEQVVKDIMLGRTVDGEFTTLDEVAKTVLFFMQFPSLALTGQALLTSHGENMR